MSGRRSPRGVSTSPAAIRANTPRELLPLPMGSILKPFEISEPPLHKFKVFENALLVVVTAAAVVGAVFLLLV